MKIRTDFVTNSSSTSYIIQMNGSTPEDRSAKAFVEDSLDVMLGYFTRYHYDPPRDPETNFRLRDPTQQEMEYQAKENIAKNRPVYHDMNMDKFFLLPTEDKIEFLAGVLEKSYDWPSDSRRGKKCYMSFGDHDRTVLGQMCDYMFRENPSSKRFNVIMPSQTR